MLGNSRAFALLALTLAAAVPPSLHGKEASIEDVRVEPMVGAQWAQKYLGGEDTFNLKTPSGYPCGCTAVSFIQVMRYWKAPYGPVLPVTRGCFLEYAPVQKTMIGGIYDWSKMPLTGDGPVSDEERDELAKLAYDFGVASHMSWGRMSGTFSELAATALQENFGYASCRMLDYEEGSYVTGKSVLSDEDGRNAILASLDAGMPVVIGVEGANYSAHTIVVDGYGYKDGKLYCHMNFGWNGQSDGWYDLIGEGLSDSAQFTAMKDIVYNIHPDVAGDVISGRVLDSDGAPVANATVSMTPPTGSAGETKTNEKGIYSFRFTGRGKFKLSASASDKGTGSRTVNVAKAGESADYVFNDSVFAMALNSLGTVANKWGEDISLSKSAEPPVEPEPPSPPGGEDPDPSAYNAVAAATFDGGLTLSGQVAGTVQVKVGKANKTTHESKVSATVVLSNGKKVAYKGVMLQNGKADLSAAGHEGMSLFIGAAEMSGSMGGFKVVGARNRYASKDKVEAKAALRELAVAVGSYNVVWSGGAVTATVSAKGAVKVSGAFADGAKISAKGQVFASEGGFAAVVVYAKAANELAFLLRVSGDGKVVSAEGLEGAVAGKVAELKDGARFAVDKGDDLWSKIPGTVLGDYLPDGLSVSQVGAKWVVAGGARPGKVAYLRGTTDVDTSKTGENPAALKFSYKAKTGTFTGSFKVYADDKGRIKATTVSISGVVVGGVGYGTATVKRVGGIAVRVE